MSQLRATFACQLAATPRGFCPGEDQNPSSVEMIPAAEIQEGPLAVAAVLHTWLWDLLLE